MSWAAISRNANQRQRDVSPLVIESAQDLVQPMWDCYRRIYAGSILA